MNKLYLVRKSYHSGHNRIRTICPQTPNNFTGLLEKLVSLRDISFCREPSLHGLRVENLLFPQWTD